MTVGSDAQMTDLQRQQVRRLRGLDIVAVVEEERRTMAQPTTGDG
jgi:hypothetical protein